MGSVVATAALEFHEAHERRLLGINSLLARNGMQRRIDMWEMVRGDVTHKRTHDLVVAHAAMQPSQEQNELHADGHKRGQDSGPVDGHARAFRERTLIA
jgi:hypothetical protein